MSRNDFGFYFCQVVPRVDLEFQFYARTSTVSKLPSDLCTLQNCFFPVPGPRILGVSSRLLAHFPLET